MRPEVDHVVVHCSATKAKQDFSAADIDRWHREFGWWGNGYHYVIKRDGYLESAAKGHRCRPLSKPGAHVGDCGPEWNRRTVGICLIGGLDKKGEPEDNFTEAQYRMLEALLIELIYGYEQIKYIGGHRDLIAQTDAPPKDCPCFEFDEFWQGLSEKYHQAERLQQIKTISQR